MYSKPIVNAGITTAASGAPAAFFSLWLAIALGLLGALMILGSSNALANFFPRLAFESHQKTDGSFVWCLRKNGVPVRAKHRVKHHA